MESVEEQDAFRGVYPEFGAIFMSSSATKKECLSRRLFGLPASQCAFVKKVKTGMILFLFEYERRELHGVFQACSDGTMNIFPGAYNKSGMQFPAQVKVKPIWRCLPLSESEFSDAIKENYFSKWKFNFGLSKSQVRRLLTLFSSRKLKHQWPQRVLARSEKERPRYTEGKVREVDDGRSVLSDEGNNELDADNSDGPTVTQKSGNFSRTVGREEGGRLLSYKVASLHKVENKAGEIIQSGYSGHSPGKVGRGDAASTICERAGSEINVDIERVTPTLGPGRREDDIIMCSRAGSVNSLDVEPTSTESAGSPFAKTKRIHFDVRFSVSDKLRTEDGEGTVFGPAIPTEYPDLFRSSFDRPVCPGMAGQEAAPLIQDQIRSNSTVCHQVELPFTSPHPASCRDAIVTSIPYDPHAPTLNIPCSPSIGVNHSSNSAHDCYDRGNILSMGNQSYPLCTEPEGINQSLYDTSKSDVRVPLAGPDHYEHSCQANIMPLPRAEYYEEMALEFSGKYGYGEPILKSSLASGALSKIGSNGRETKRPSSYSLSPGTNHSFVIEGGHSVALQDKVEHERAQKVNYEPFTSYQTSSEERQCQLQCGIHSGDRGTVDHQEHKSFDHDFKSDETSQGRSSDLLNKRSVFSRLAFNSDTRVKNSTHVGYEENDKDTSVDEVMAMLCESLHQWVKSEKSRQPTRRHEDVEKSRNEKQTIVRSELDSNYLEVEVTPKKSNMASTTPAEDKDDQICEQIPFVDFKRRSELRKVNGCTKARATDEGAGNDIVSGGQRKRRKLIRPNFSDTKPHDDKCIDLELLPSVELSPNNGDVSHGSVIGSLNLELQRVAKEVEICVDDNHHGSSKKQSEASLDTVGRFNKQGSSQEHRSSKLSEPSVGTVGCLNKLEPSQEVRDLNVRFGERLLILSTGLRNSEIDTYKRVDRKRVDIPVSGSKVCKSSDTDTSECGDYCASVNNRLWRILTSRLKDMKNAQHE